ncbi:MAG: T9SS type A sorting domain-containing protein [Bacteroidales bacterium]|nr:T9SS type A sorting domain-containing protein [Bacteroidales bacterium]
MKKSSLLLFFFFLLFSINSFSQAPQWQWVKIGGSMGSPFNDEWKESTREIVTDSHGNIYGISNIGNFYVVLDSINYLNGPGYDDFCLYSYTCNGEFRWVRFFSSSMPDYGGDVAIDSHDNIFITGRLSFGQNSESQVGDTIILQDPNYLKVNFIAKIDTTGHTDWVSIPGPQFLAGFPSVRYLQVEVDNQNNPIVLARIQDSCTYEGYSIPVKGQYLLKFDSSTGNLLDVNRLEVRMMTMSGTDYSFYFKIDSVDNNIYYMGEVADSTEIGEDTVLNNVGISQVTTLLARFSPNGEHIWHTVVSGIWGTESMQMIFGKPAILGNSIYISGFTQAFANSNILGVPVTNIIGGGIIWTRIFAKFNKSTGEIQSALNLHSTDNIYTSELAIRNDKVIAACSGGTVVIMNQTDTVVNSSEFISNDPFIIEMDSTLTQFTWSSVTEAAGKPQIKAITTDKSGNIYVGGSTNSTIYNSYGEATWSVGGDDFFIAKISASNCCGNELANPDATLISFEDNLITVNGLVANPADSLYWIWGDGDSTQYQNSGTDISHYYSTSGPYSPCLKSWNSCGVEEDCLSNLYSGIANIQVDDIKCYPNPFHEGITLELPNALIGGTFEVFSIAGQLLYTQPINHSTESIHPNSLDKGIYLLKITSPTGAIYLKRVIKF